MKNKKIRKAMSYVKNTKAMKHIEKKIIHQKNITKNISTTIVATMSPITTTIATITIVHCAQVKTTNHTHQKNNKKN
jgi:hypothetical protein